MMNLILLSKVYPSQFAAKGTTPVVHYFAREWVKAGHKVTVFHTASMFPFFYYTFGRVFGKALYSRLGYAAVNKRPEVYVEVVDGVKIHHIFLKKWFPHGRFPKRAIIKARDAIVAAIDKTEIPDCFVGHWSNPQLELLFELKREFNRPTCIVYHDNDFAYLFDNYGKDTECLVKDVNLVGFRNYTARQRYISLFGEPKGSFIAASGVSQPFISAGRSLKRKYDETRSRFVFVGALIPRKYPAEVLQALLLSYGELPFELTFIGEGEEKNRIEAIYALSGKASKVSFTGRIPRDEIIRYLKEADFFVMISKDEVFGLVYLEAMALGCVPIASRGEGIDGIIIDGENGFLCESGNVGELASIVSWIREMDAHLLQEISIKARKTALLFSDENVAKGYLEKIQDCVLNNVDKG